LSWYIRDQYINKDGYEIVVCRVETACCRGFYEYIKIDGKFFLAKTMEPCGFNVEYLIKYAIDNGLIYQGEVPYERKL
jgi:hypothetical protein